MTPSRLSQTLILGFDGRVFTKEARSFIQKYQPAGFIFFKDNCQSLAHFHKLLSAIRNFYHTTLHREPWLTIDHEGGAVHRLPPPATQFAPARVIGETKTPDEIHTIGACMARQLRALGINVNFSPVCDIHTSQTPDYLADRTYGSSPRAVADCVREMTLGLQDNGVMACAKHFPGIGRAAHDPHKKMIFLARSAAEFENEEWVPFRVAITNNVASIMTTHVVCTGLDPTSPITYSLRVIKDLLMGELNFGGPIISDDIQMGAVSMPPCDAIINALAARHTLVINSERSFEKNTRTIERACQKNAAASEMNEIIEANIEAAETAIAPFAISSPQSWSNARRGFGPTSS